MPDQRSPILSLPPSGTAAMVLGVLDGLDPVVASERWEALGAAETAAWGAIDLSESGGTYRVTIELPGCAVCDIEVALGAGMLTISGEKRQHLREVGERLALAGRRYGAFRCTLPVPDGVALDRVSASYLDGVLEVVLPKLSTAATCPRTIPLSPR